MTNEEAIKVLSSWAECKYKPTHDAARLGIAALRAQAEAERNKPLTRDGCKYCLEDCDGFTVALPKSGKGSASIQSTMQGPHMAVSGPNRTHFDIPIVFCPICGRNLTIRRKPGEGVI